MTAVAQVAALPFAYHINKSQYFVFVSHKNKKPYIGMNVLLFPSSKLHQPVLLDSHLL
jgi:hypothetical protein